MHVIFIHGAPASGKHTIGVRLAAMTGIPLFHNHLAVDTAKSLFAFGTPGFNRMRATIWRSAFAEAAAAGQSFIFTFNPEATVDSALIDELRGIVHGAGGQVHFVQLICSRETVLRRLGNESRKRFEKLVDPELYRSVEAQGAFDFPPLPAPLLVVDTDALDEQAAAGAIAEAIATDEEAA